MKTLFIIRHAKSSWAEPHQSDFERSLNERGKKDAPIMAGRLHKKINSIDYILCSSALRTKQTGEFFCKEFNLENDSIEYVDKLYHAPASIIFSVVKKLNDKLDSVVVICHNPGITEFVNSLCYKVHIDNMPTCAIFAVQIKKESWKDFESAEREFLFIDYPKKN
jgi:phosphohistidine phosphatase